MRVVLLAPLCIFLVIYKVLFGMLSYFIGKRKYDGWNEEAEEYWVDRKEGDNFPLCEDTE